MFQTGYKGIANIVRSNFFYTGFCKLWFTPIENILSWPAVDPLTQFLSTEPVLKVGTTWYGPMKVPDKQSDFGETLQVTAAGPYYKQKLSCYLPGDDGYTRVNAANLVWSEFVFLGLVRAGGYFQVFGNDQNGVTLTENEFSNNTNNAAGRRFSFTANSLDPAQVLMNFSLSPSTPPAGWEIPGEGTDPEPGTGAGNETEIISFTTETEITIPWTDLRIERFTTFPIIQVWKYVAGKPELINVPIGCDDEPGSQTYFTVYTPGTPGFIVLK